MEQQEEGTENDSLHEDADLESKHALLPKQPVAVHISQRPGLVKLYHDTCNKYRYLLQVVILPHTWTYIPCSHKACRSSDGLVIGSTNPSDDLHAL